MAITPDIPEVDTAVLGRAISEHRSSLESLVRARVPRHDVDDVLQSLYVRAHERWHTYDFDRPLGPWLHAIARNLCADHGRAARRGEVAVDPSMLHGPPSPSPEQVIDLREGRAALRRAWQALPDERRGLVAAGAEGRPYSEIAAKLHLTEEAVRGRLQRARQELRALAQRAEEGLLALMLPFRRWATRLSEDAAQSLSLAGPSVGQVAVGLMAVVALVGVGFDGGVGSGGGDGRSEQVAGSLPASSTDVEGVVMGDADSRASSPHRPVAAPPPPAGRDAASPEPRREVRNDRVALPGGSRIDVERDESPDAWELNDSHSYRVAGIEVLHDEGHFRFPCTYTSGQTFCTVARLIP